MIIQVIGQPFSGKTSLAKYISKKLNIKYFCAEDMYYNDYQKVTDDYADLILNNNDFIIDGSISWFYKSAFFKRDILIWVETDDNERIERINNLEMKIDWLKKIDYNKYYKYNDEYFELSRNYQEKQKLLNLLFMEFEIADSKKIIIDGAISNKEQFKIIIDLILEKKKKNYLKGNIDLFKVYKKEVGMSIKNIKQSLKIVKSTNIKQTKLFEKQYIKYEKLISNDKYISYKNNLKNSFRNSKKNIKNIYNVSNISLQPDKKLVKDLSSLTNYKTAIETSKFIKNIIKILDIEKHKLKR
ncbi:hypothetical protein SCORR_v1c03860 [Spiroplasma corruscae]|uniref:Uncharacterized protein n=1 Tax=Spiroplasma corruscae TaxID=216934 RepID=A0A222ENT5_9MOLU|nr:hypothetical protein [Spiroplasma corruscae]ASP28160.1 hypothetical protein SCORR_v1c03860 [Spiroplasma corruscae]